MKAISTTLSFALALAFSNASGAQEASDALITINPVYSCKATISKDWSEIKKESYILLETDSFEIPAEESTAVIAKADSFKVVSDKSTLTSVKESDLGQFEIAIRVIEKGNSLGLEGTFTLKPTNMKKEIHIVEESVSTGKLPEKLSINTKIMFGNDREVGKSGPVESTVDCELKRKPIASSVFRARKKTSEF